MQRCPLLVCGEQLDDARSEECVDPSVAAQLVLLAEFRHSAIRHGRMAGRMAEVVRVWQKSAEVPSPEVKAQMIALRERWFLGHCSLDLMYGILSCTCAT